MQFWTKIDNSVKKYWCFCAFRCFCFVIIGVFVCFLVFSGVFLCFLVFFWCFPLFLLVFVGVFLCFLVFFGVFLCFLLFSTVFQMPGRCILAFFCPELTRIENFSFFFAVISGNSFILVLLCSEFTFLASHLVHISISLSGIHFFSAEFSKTMFF